MIGKQILLNQSVESEITDIVNEVLIYAENQSKIGKLYPDYYYETLLLISEMLPHMDNQDRWINFGYKLCNDLKQDLEKNGYHWTAMLGGLGNQCFAVDAFCKQANILDNFSHSLNKLLFIAIDKKIDQIKNDETCEYNYDLVSGISGTLYYLLDCDYTQEEKHVIMKCIEYLLAFTKDADYGGQTVIKFHVQKLNQNKNYEQKEFKAGGINFGLAHGMIAPLIALAKAYAKGFILDGLRDGIEKVYQLYETFKSVDKENVPHWPRMITVEEYMEGTCKPEHLHIPSSWCYGNVGIIRGLQKVAGYMNWSETEQAYIKTMKHIYAQEIKEYNLFSPSLCHGFSSLVAIQTCAYSAYGDPELLCHLERNVQQIISAYRKSNEHEVNLVDIRSKMNRVEGYLEDLSLLTGSTGVAITLLSLKGTIATGKLLMID